MLVIENKKVTKAIYTNGSGNDINFDAYLEGEDYNQIAVFAPLAQAPTTKNWLGLGGGYYRYSGKNIYYCIINDTMHYGSPNAETDGKIYDVRTAVLIHEMLHCVETNSVLRGWSGFQPLHDHEKNGYVYSRELEQQLYEVFRKYTDKRQSEEAGA